MSELDHQTQKYQSGKDKDGAKEEDKTCSLEEGNTTNDDTEGHFFSMKQNWLKWLSCFVQRNFWKEMRQSNLQVTILQGT